MSIFDFELCLPWPECLHGTDHPKTNGTLLAFLGFTHISGKARAGRNAVRQVTPKNRYATFKCPA
jgi:hypothetical protein